jgi:hypothetical protein
MLIQMLESLISRLQKSFSPERPGPLLVEALLNIIMAVIVLTIFYLIWRIINYLATARLMRRLDKTNIAFVLATDRPFTIDDLIEIDGKYGRADRISLRTTRIVTPDGQCHSHEQDGYFLYKFSEFTIGYCRYRSCYRKPGSDKDDFATTWRNHHPA